MHVELGGQVREGLHHGNQVFFLRPSVYLRRLGRRASAFLKESKALLDFDLIELTGPAERLLQSCAVVVENRLGSLSLHFPAAQQTLRGGLRGGRCASPLPYRRGGL